jgi:TRAP-type mannitol/chloroaromatic compound transport system permease small subunit
MTMPALAETKLSYFAERLRYINRYVGRAIAWLTFMMVIVTSIVVIERYWFSTGSIRLQESVSFMHAAVFMLAAAYTLAVNGHVRVDIFYSRMSPKKRALVDLLGTLILLLPFCIFLIWTSWDYVTTSWAIQESSRETGGLPFPFPAIRKSFIPIAALLLILQGLAMVLESVQVLRGFDKQKLHE